MIPKVQIYFYKYVELFFVAWRKNKHKKQKDKIFADYAKKFTTGNKK